MSFVRSSPVDEALHKRHHARVTRGIVWDGLGKGKGKASERDVGWKVVRDGLRFGWKDEGGGRVVVCDGSWGGSKVSP
jgi:N-acetyltransferase